MGTRAHWDALAAVWEPWEHLGTRPRSLAPWLSRLRSPVLVVGAGQGLLMERLAQRGLTVHGVDASVAMIEQARARRGLVVELADAAALPFEAGRFGSAVVASGVLGVGGADETLLAECARVTRPDGLLLASWFRPSPEVLRVGREVGYVAGRLQVQSRLFALWRSGGEPEVVAGLVAEWTGVSPVAAAATVRRYATVLASIRADVEALADRARQLSLDPVPLLRQALDFWIEARTEDEARELLARVGVEGVQVVHEPDVSLSTYGGTRRGQEARATDFVAGGGG